MSRYLAAYDVADDARRGRVARALMGWGRRLQRSVFEVRVEPEQLPRFRREMGGQLGARDAFELVPIDGRPGRPRLRWDPEPRACRVRVI